MLVNCVRATRLDFFYILRVWCKYNGNYGHQINANGTQNDDNKPQNECEQTISEPNGTNAVKICLKYIRTHSVYRFKKAMNV